MRKPFILVVLVGCLGGCSGQEVTGAWRGAFPLPGARDCRIRMYSDHTFDLSSHDSKWLAGGKYDRDRGVLTFRFLAIAKKGEKVPNPAPVTIKFEGRGNYLRTSAGEWRRLSSGGWE